MPRELFGKLSHSQEKSYEITKIFGGFGADFYVFLLKSI
jgi:hypothetical protein